MPISPISTPTNALPVAIKASSSESKPKSTPIPKEPSSVLLNPVALLILSLLGLAFLASCLIHNQSSGSAEPFRGDTSKDSPKADVVSWAFLQKEMTPIDKPELALTKSTIGAALLADNTALTAVQTSPRIRGNALSLSSSETIGSDIRFSSLKAYASLPREHDFLDQIRDAYNVETHVFNGNQFRDRLEGLAFPEGLRDTLIGRLGQHRNPHYIRLISDNHFFPDDLLPEVRDVDVDEDRERNTQRHFLRGWVQETAAYQGLAPFGKRGQTGFIELYFDGISGCFGSCLGPKYDYFADVLPNIQHQLRARERRRVHHEAVESASRHLMKTIGKPVDDAFVAQLQERPPAMAILNSYGNVFDTTLGGNSYPVYSLKVGPFENARLYPRKLWIRDERDSATYARAATVISQILGWLGDHAVFAPIPLNNIPGIVAAEPTIAAAVNRGNVRKNGHDHRFSQLMVVPDCADVDEGFQPGAGATPLRNYAAMVAASSAVGHSDLFASLTSINEHGEGQIGASSDNDGTLRNAVATERNHLCMIDLATGAVGENFTPAHLLRRVHYFFREHRSPAWQAAIGAVYNEDDTRARIANFINTIYQRRNDLPEEGPFRDNIVTLQGQWNA